VAVLTFPELHATVIDCAHRRMGIEGRGDGLVEAHGRGGCCFQFVAVAIDPDQQQDHQLSSQRSCEPPSSLDPLL